ncbi:ATP synthase subunit b [Arenibacter antarcticus]|uniref:ATP synthase subunit b n=1 Tax=Arenibacter antarcticus TaxID=2040469 RepID=A0ABW5VHH0_9FLAO|nr:F0F1 ATP synthase subunit delta [Arenibacter sp. H213]
MEINWFTVIAQIVNFLILVWLLKRFLYQPVLNAIDEREKKIASQLDDAEAKKAESEKEHKVFRQKNEVFDKERAAKMDEAQEQVNSEKQRLFEEVRKESTLLRSKYETSLKQQEQEITDRLKRKTKEEVFAIAGKALSDLANANLEEQVIKVFIKKIKDLDEGNIAKLKNAFDNDKAITIKSAFEPSATSKQELEKTIEKITRKKNNFKYLLAPEVVGGIEIYTESYQLSWNIESYLDSLKKDSILKE